MALSCIEGSGKAERDGNGGGGKGSDCATGVTLEILLRNARPDEFAWKFAVEARRTPRERINSVTSNERRRWREKLR